jgi:hypothetical protein
MTDTTAFPLFYRQPRPLDAHLHAGYSLAPTGNYSFAADTNSVPLLASEFTNACRHYPIVFATAQNVQPLALLGLRNGENLFVDAQGRWAEDHHIPAYVRRYPFIFMESEDQQKFTLCIDAAAGSVVQSPENPLFKDGSPTELTQKALEFCRAFQGEYHFTREFAHAALDAGLLAENRADITLKSGEKQSLAGFRVIDESRFNKLPSATFLQWRERGWLPLVYAHLTSMGNWATLVNRGAGVRRS